jgi:hypothetical protein
MAQSRSRTGQMRASDIYLAVLALLALPHVAIALWMFLGRVRWSLIVAAVLAVAGAGSVPLIWGAEGKQSGRMTLQTIFERFAGPKVQLIRLAELDQLL